MIRLIAVLALVFGVGCRREEASRESGKTQQAIEVGGALPHNAMQVAGLTWFAIEDPPMTSPSAMAARCAAGTFLSQSGWRMPTQAEVQELVSATAMSPRPPPLHTIVSSTPSGGGYWGVQGPTVIIAPPDMPQPRTVCVSQPQNMATLANLTWYRNTQAPMPAGAMAAWCSGLTVMGRGGWRLPTEAEARTFYANQAHVPNAAHWRTANGVSDAPLVASTPYMGGQFVVSLANGNMVGVPPGWVGHATCVTGAGLPATAASWGGLVWVRDAAPPPEPDVVAYCASATLLGRGGWRIPTQAEAQSLYTNRASIPQYSSWLAVPPPMLVTATPVPGGVFGIDLNFGNALTLPSPSGPRTCVIPEPLGGIPSGWGPTDPCLANNGGCSVNATCLNNSGVAVCQCRPGFSGDGVTCTDVNECATNNGGCSADATCSNTTGSFTCTCNSGFRGPGSDGFICNQDSACATNFGGCFASGLCVSPAGCYCPVGTVGDGRSCTPVPVCAAVAQQMLTMATFEDPVVVGAEVHQPNQNYVNAGHRRRQYFNATGWLPAPERNQFGYVKGGGSFTMTAPVPSGTYRLQLQIARGKEPGVPLPIQPLSVHLDGVFLSQATPTSNVLFDTWTLPNVALTEGQRSLRFSVPAGAATVLIDAVTVSLVTPTTPAPMGCTGIASCNTTTYSCSCQPGYTGSGTTCVDINECLTGNGGCGANATCTNTPGSRTCACNAGYAGDGFTCSDVNECMGGTLPTQASAGFEAPATTSWVYQPTDADGWAFTEGGVRSGAWAYGMMNGPPAPEGSQYAYVGTAMQKTLTLTGSMHTLSFRAARDRGAYEFQPTASDLALPFRVLVDGVVQGTYAPQSTTNFTAYSLTFSAAPGSHTIRFENASHLKALIDSVVVVQGLVGPSGNGGCSAQASCSNTVGGRTCTCLNGFSGDGFTCADVNECPTNNGGCSPNAICTNTVGSRTCACSPGYSGAGLTCQDINECQTNNGGCAPLPSGVCTNTPGSRTCACGTGFSGNGFACEDINECLTNHGGCAAAPAGLCLNTAGSHVCRCATGYSGSGLVCTDINECLTNNGDCAPAPAGVCTNTAGSRTCACGFGYVGNGLSCVRDCSVNNGSCSRDAICAVNSGVLSCTCAPGFTGDGLTCTDIDECASGNGGCSANATCTNLIGAPAVCACRSGFSGDGVTCAADSITEPALSPGKTATSFSVTNTGGFDYRIPLWTPPGVGGAQLRLALAYGGSGNGPFGVGWDLSGLQSLTRCAGKYLSKGAVRPIAMTQQDALCLNGQELVVLGGTHGAIGSVYGAEVEDFSRIETGSSMQGTAPQTFTVTTKNGPIYTFGAGASVPDAPATPWRWLLSRVADRAGNSIAFSYLPNAENVALLSTITGPTTATGQGPFWKVQFNYEARTAADTTVSYFVGALVKQTQRVRSIEMTELPSNRLLRRYVLTYEQGESRRSRLTTIQECTAASCLAPVVVTYANGQTTRPFTATAQYSSAPVYVGAGGVVPADLNGDGKTDIMWCAFVPGGFCNWLARLSTGTEFGSDIQLSSGAVPASLRVLPGAYANGRVQVLIPTPTPPHLYELAVLNGAGTDFERAPTGLLPSTADTVGDFDGDGLADLFQVDSTKGGSIRLRRNATAPGGPIGFENPVTLFTAPGDTVFSEGAYTVTRPKFGGAEWEMGVAAASPSAVKVGDFNGDGRADLAVSLFRLTGAWNICAHARNQSGITLCELGFKFLQSNGLSGGAVVPMTELASLNNIDTRGQREDGTYGTMPYLPPRLSFVNWNDDRCTDTILNGGDFGGLRLSNCKDGFAAPMAYSGTLTMFTTPPHYAKTLAIDLNNDGRDDYLQTGAGLCYSSIFRSLSLSTGDGFTAESPGWSGDCLFTHPSNSTSVLGNSHDGVVLDANGDGRSDVFFYQSATDTSGAPMAMRLYLRSGLTSEETARGTRVAIEPPPDAVTSFTDSVGVKTKVFYGTATAIMPPLSWPSPVVPTGVYSPNTTSPVFPVVDYQPTSMLVSAWRVEAPSESPSAGGLDTLQYEQKFHYFGAKVHLQGRGFLGFSGRATSDSRTVTMTTEAFSQEFPTTGMTSAATVSIDTFGLVQTLSRSTVTLAAKALSRGRFFPYAEGLVREKYEVRDPWSPLSTKSGLVSTETTTRVVDDFGNPTSVTTATTDVDATPPVSDFNGQTWTTVETRTFDNNTVASAWCLGLPSTFTVTTSAPGQPARTRTTGYANNVTRQCRVNTETVEPSGAPRYQTATSYQYDGCGNVREARVVGHAADGSALTPRVATIDWGTRCQFPEKKWDALNQLRQTSYDFSLGVPRTQTDFNGAVTTYDHDSFARPTRVLHPDGTSTTTRYSSVNSKRPFASREASYGSDGSLQGVQTSVFDVFDNQVSSTSTQSPTGRTIVQNTTYDWLNRVVQSDVPYLLGGSRSGYSWVTYDAVGRVTARMVSQPRGGTSYSVERGKAYTYLGRTVVEHDATRGGNTDYDVVRLTDVAGKLRRIAEPRGGGTSRYDYDGFGALVRAQTPDSVSSWSYDVNGFKVQEADADRGTTSFVVNSLGEVTGATDAKLQSRSFTYDLLGRMTHRSEPEGTSVWTYGTAAPELGQLTTVTGPGYTERSAYDSLGRLRQTTVVADGTHVFDYSYNALGQLDTVTYPETAPGARFTLKRHYAFGDVVSLSDQSTGKSLWRLGSRHETGLPATSYLGAARVRVERSYKPATLELETLVSTAPGAALGGLQNLNYIWESKGGSLEVRRDYNRNIVESFTYDALERLRTVRLNAVQTLALTYTPSGNVETRNGLSLAYADPSHPHAVTGFGGSSFSYDANGNMRTRGGATQTWSSFDMPTTLVSSQGRSDFSYSPMRTKYREIVRDAAGAVLEQRTTVAGLFEKVVASGQTRYRNLVTTPDGLLIIKTPTSTSLVLKDHLGSTDLILSDPDGAVTNRASFDVYGARRNVSTWTGLPPTSEVTALNSVTRAGFTGHENVDALSLVHMGGRVFDPALGRFLSVDPLSDPADPQTLNPYTYVRNRPLSLTDPSGFWDDSGDSFEMPSLNLDYANSLFGNLSFSQLTFGTPNFSFTPTFTGVESGPSGIAQTQVIVITGSRIKDSNIGGDGAAEWRSTLDSANSLFGGKSNVHPFTGWDRGWGAQSGLTKDQALAAMRAVDASGARWQLKMALRSELLGAMFAANPTMMADNLVEGGGYGKTVLAAAAGGALVKKGVTKHGAQRTAEGQVDAHRQVGDSNRIVRDGTRYVDTRTGHDVYVLGDRAVVMGPDGKVSQFINDRANTLWRIETQRWQRPVSEWFENWLKQR